MAQGYSLVEDFFIEPAFLIDSHIAKIGHHRRPAKGRQAQAKKRTEQCLSG